MVTKLGSITINMHPTATGGSSQKTYSRITPLQDHGDRIYSTSFIDSKILEDRTIQQIGTELLEALNEVKAKKGKALIVSFSGVKYHSSACNGKLITLRRKSDQDDVKLYLCDISTDALDVFKIAKLEDYFEALPNTDLNSRTTLMDVVNSLKGK